jgi:cytoskeletal protein CcmA (bactofilin family)
MLIRNALPETATRRGALFMISHGGKNGAYKSYLKAFQKTQRRSNSIWFREWPSACGKGLIFETEETVWKGEKTVWNKRPEGPPESSEPVGRLQGSIINRQEAAPAPPTSTVAVIGSSMSIRGEIRTREELVVDGEVEGILESQSLLTVGPNGKVKANIKAREVVVFGSVRGNVDAAEKIAIRDHGKVIGDIKTCGISIDDGAYFKGSIDISRPEPSAATKAVKSDAPIPVGAV